MLQNILADYDPVTRALAPIDEFATSARTEESDSYSEEESEEESDPENVDLEEAMTQIAMMNSLRA